MPTTTPRPDSLVRVVVHLGDTLMDIAVPRDELNTAGPAREALLQGYEALLHAISSGNTVIASATAPAGSPARLGQYWLGLVESLTVAAARFGIELRASASPSPSVTAARNEVAKPERPAPPGPVQLLDVAEREG